MFSRLSSAFNAVKEKASSLVSKAKDIVAPYLPASIDPRPAVHERVMQTMQEAPTKKAPIILEMPDRRDRPAQARQPQSIKRGMFGIQTWAQQDDLSLGDYSTSPFRDFGYEGMMDETPETEAFYEEVHMRAFNRGDHYYDPLYNYNHEIPKDSVSVRAPVAVPTFAPTPVFANSHFFQTAAAAANTDVEQGAFDTQQGAQVIPFRRPAPSVPSVPAARPAPSVADAWLMGDRAFERARARTRDRVGNVLDRAA